MQSLFAVISLGVSAKKASLRVMILIDIRRVCIEWIYCISRISARHDLVRIEARYGRGETISSSTLSGCTKKRILKN